MQKLIYGLLLIIKPDKETPGMHIEIIIILSNIVCVNAKFGKV